MKVTVRFAPALRYPDKGTCPSLPAPDKRTKKATAILLKKIFANFRKKVVSIVLVGAGSFTALYYRIKLNRAGICFPACRIVNQSYVCLLMAQDSSGNEMILLTATETRWSGGFLQQGIEGLSLEKKVTRYFEQWREQVYRYLVAVFGHAELAEEFTQEAFLRLYKALHSGEAIVNARAWVFRVAHNLAVNQIKSQQFLAPVTDEAWEELCRTLQDATPGPEQRLLQQEKLQRMRTAIARLTQAERESLHLRSKGFRYREMAEILGLSTTTVAETLYRVIEKLAREINE